MDSKMKMMEKDQMAKYTFPLGTKLFSCDFYLFKEEKTVQAICYAAEWIDNNPNVDIKYERLFNVILASNDETVALTKEVYEACNVKSCVESFFDEIDFGTYAIAMTFIKLHGWIKYIQYLRSK